MAVRMRPEINYTRWSKLRLREYVTEHSLPVTSTGTRGPIRKDYLQAVRASESKYKNLNKKTKADLQKLIDERKIPQWVVLPSGKRGRQTKDDLIRSIKYYRYDNINETISQVNFGDVVPRIFANALENLQMRNLNCNLDPKTFLDKSRSKIIKESTRLLQTYRQIKLQLGIKLTFIKSNPLEEDNEVTATFLSNQAIILRRDQLQRAITDMIANLLNKIEKFQGEKNG